MDDARSPSTQVSIVVDRCCSRTSNDLAQVRVPIGSGWAATDIIKVSEIVTGSGVSLATKYLAFFRRGDLDFGCLADRQIGYAQNDGGVCGV